MFKKRPARWAAVAVTLGMLFEIGYGGGCYNLATQSVTNSIMPCAIFDCSGGFLGGAIDPCNPNTPIFNNCP